MGHSSSDPEPRVDCMWTKYVFGSAQYEFGKSAYDVIIYLGWISLPLLHGD